jgi:hypothetical protein
MSSGALSGPGTSIVFKRSAIAVARDAGMDDPGRASIGDPGNVGLWSRSLFVTGSSGLIGSELVAYFAELGRKAWGIYNTGAAISSAHRRYRVESRNSVITPINVFE